MADKKDPFEGPPNVTPLFGKKGMDSAADRVKEHRGEAFGRGLEEMWAKDEIGPDEEGDIEAFIKFDQERLERKIKQGIIVGEGAIDFVREQKAKEWEEMRGWNYADYMKHIEIVQMAPLTAQSQAEIRDYIEEKRRECESFEDDEREEIEDLLKEETFDVRNMLEGEWQRHKFSLTQIPRIIQETYIDPVDRAGLEKRFQNILGQAVLAGEKELEADKLLVLTHILSRDKGRINPATLKVYLGELVEKGVFTQEQARGLQGGLIIHEGGHKPDDPGL